MQNDKGEDAKDKKERQICYCGYCGQKYEGWKHEKCPTCGAPDALNDDYKTEWAEALRKKWNITT